MEMAETGGDIDKSKGYVLEFEVGRYRAIFYMLWFESSNGVEDLGGSPANTTVICMKLILVSGMK